MLLQYWIQRQGLKVLVIFEGRGSAGKGGVIKRITERTSPAHRPGRGAAQADRAAADPVVLPALRRAPARRGRDGDVRPLLVQPLERRVGDGLLHRGGAPGVPAHLSGVRADAGALGDHGHQVLVLGVLRGAAQALRGPQRRAAQALEALRHGPRRARALRALLDGQGHDVPVHRHQAGALVRRAVATTRRPPGSTASTTCSRSSTTSTSRPTSWSCRRCGRCPTCGRRCTSRPSCRTCSEAPRSKGSRQARRIVVC